MKRQPLWSSRKRCRKVSSSSITLHKKRDHCNRKENTPLSYMSGQLGLSKLWNQHSTKNSIKRLVLFGTHSKTSSEIWHGKESPQKKTEFCKVSRWQNSKAIAALEPVAFFLAKSSNIASRTQQPSLVMFKEECSIRATPTTEVSFQSRHMTNEASLYFTFTNCLHTIASSLLWQDLKPSTC